MTQSEHLRLGEWLVLLDGANLLVFANDGTVDAPALAMRLHKGVEDPPTRDLGTDRPGRVYQSVGSRRSGMEAPDYHEEAEAAFVRSAVDALADAVETEDVTSLIVAAPPRAIAVFRSTVGDDLRRRIRHEIVADLVNQPTPELERRFCSKGT